jgi:SulP family sulfate permease
MSSLHSSASDGFDVLVLNLGRVPVIDATGLAALENAIASVLRRKKKVILAGPLPRPKSVFDKARLAERYPGLSFASDLDAAVAFAGELVQSAPISIRPAAKATAG